MQLSLWAKFEQALPELLGDPDLRPLQRQAMHTTTAVLEIRPVAEGVQQRFAGNGEQSAGEVG